MGWMNGRGLYAVRAYERANARERGLLFQVPVLRIRFPVWIERWHFHRNSPQPLNGILIYH